MVSLEKELGMSTKDAKALIKAKKDADEGARSDLEKLTGERDSFKTELDGAKLQLAKMESLLEAGIPAEKIPKLLKRVSGKTTEEIKADIAEMKADGLIPTATPPAAAQGAGNAGVPGTPGAKKRWTKSEIQKVAKTADAKTLEEINLAQSEGRVDYDK
jgi:DNA-binding transcriptional MerR regulator